MVKKVIKKTITETYPEEKPKKVPTTKRKKTTRRTRTTSTTTTSKKKMTAAEREQLLIENFVGLQHAMTNISIKFGYLSDNISRLLQVYEEAARSYASNGKTDNEDMLKKINSLLDQNKTIAKGLVLLEGKLRSTATPEVNSNQQIIQTRPSMQVQNQLMNQNPLSIQNPVIPKQTPEQSTIQSQEFEKPSIKPRPLPSI